MEYNKQQQLWNINNNKGNGIKQTTTVMEYK